MSNGKLKQIGERETLQSQKSMLYLLALAAAIVVVIVAIAFAVR